MTMENTQTLRNLLTCPISCVFFQDPVVAEDGHTYEKSAIIKWIQERNTSPKTGERIFVNRLYSNRLIKSIIDSFNTFTRTKQYQFELGVDIKKKSVRPLFQTQGKSIFSAEWLKFRDLPEIVLLKIDGARAKKEAEFYVQLTRHSNIVRTFGLVCDPSRAENTSAVYLLQEYAPKGSLYDLMQDIPTMPPEKILIEIFLQIIEAMIFLAANNIVHGDLACRNVLVFRFDLKNPERNVVKITDFGLSRCSSLYTIVPSNMQTKLDIVPIRYAAPEVLIDSTNSQNYTEKSDVYSMGVLMWEAYSQASLPWNHLEKDNDVIAQVVSGNVLPRPKNCSQPYWEIILKTWAKSPNNRPTFNELKRLMSKEYYSSDASMNNTPRWRRLSPGINLEGQCVNESCQAFKKGNVIVPIGMGKFDVLLNTDETTSICPMCLSYVNPDYIVFSKCRWRWSGIRQCGNAPPQRCFADWQIMNDDYYKFVDTNGTNIRWRQLILEATQL